MYRLLSKCRPIRNARKRLRLRRRLYYRSGWVNNSTVSERPIIIVGGCERSGTTLLRATLDSHPNVAAGPESWVFVYRLNLPFLASEYGFPLTDLQAMRAESSCLTEFIDRFAGSFCEREGKPIWCEKSPQNIFRLPYIWEHFPNARVIHIIRDARDVVCSLRHHPQRIRVNGGYVPNDVTNPLSECIHQWVSAVSEGTKYRGDERYMEVRYEDLVREYESTAKRICAHCQIDWNLSILERERVQAVRQDTEIVNPEVRKPLYQSAIGRWKQDLNERELRNVMNRAEGMLHVLGYK